MNSKLAIVVVLISALLMGTVLAIIYTQINSTGNIQAEPKIVPTPATIDWGSFPITTTSIAKTVTLENTGDLPTAPLHMIPTQTNPATPIIGTVTWDKENTVIAAHSSIVATFTLTVDPSITYRGDFSIDITING